MKFYFFEILIFCFILFLYIHICHQLKTNSDLEVYEINDPTKDELENICENKQPLIIRSINGFDQNTINLLKLDNIQNSYGFFDINITNTKEDNDNLQKYVHITLDEAVKLFKKDKKNKYITQNNSDFINETTIEKLIKKNDIILRPYLLSMSNYDYIVGGKDTYTVLQKNISYRNFFIVTQGSITIKLIPPESTKYLRENREYEYFEFTSPLNPWNIQEKYKNDLRRIKTLDVTINEGEILFIPSFWWYSIKMNELSSIVVSKYWTHMNIVATTPHHLLYLLQNQNISNKRFNVIDKNKK